MRLKYPRLNFADCWVRNDQWSRNLNRHLHRNLSTFYLNQETFRKCGGIFSASLKKKNTRNDMKNLPNLSSLEFLYQIILAAGLDFFTKHSKTISWFWWISTVELALWPTISIKAGGAVNKGKKNSSVSNFYNFEKLSKFSCFVIDIN